MILLSILVLLFQEGIEIKDLVNGNGYQAQSGDRLKVHYLGKLQSNNEEFDNSFNRNEPLEFVLGAGKLIQGWEIGLIGVQVGTRRQLIIQPNYAYGDRKVGPIPANSILIFEIKVLDIIKADRGWDISIDSKSVKGQDFEYFILKNGKGDSAKNNSKVTYHYTIYRSDRIKIASSQENQTEQYIVLGEKKYLIPAFENALYGVKKGEQRKIYCINRTDDGEDTFIFDVEILDVQ